MTVSFESASGPARRTVVAAAGAAGLAVALAACGGSDDDAPGSSADAGEGRVARRTPSWARPG
ncbi:hypothetical protein ABZ283_26075, partial [Streptomyces sp. NPDC006147]